MSSSNTKQNIKYFETCINEAIEFLGLYDIQFHIISQRKDVRASIYYDSISDSPFSDGRIVTIAYSDNWIKDPNTTKEDIRKTAFHEILESLFHKLRDFSLNTDYVVLPREVDSEIHRFIRIFENRMLPLIKTKKVSK